MTTVLDVQRFKDESRRFTMLTAYDFLSAQILDQAGIPILLVGDSLGMVMLGYPTTLPVTMDEMIHHAKAVSRGARQALLVGDMPFMSYHSSTEQAIESAGRFVKEGGMHAVKLEGGGRIAELTQRLTGMGIPVMGHLGLTPQFVHQMGGFKVQGKTEAQAARILADARELEAAGAFSLVLEGVPTAVASRVTKSLRIPTIGIGAGPQTDGQVLVFHDFVGLTTGKAPKFVKRYANLADEISRAAQRFSDDVRNGTFPGPEHEYTANGSTPHAESKRDEVKYGAG
ncbi:MAG: 3-methyl-2-oxobutanoate hydroxymethyltransferase [Actinobacteria bacterium 13_2_20CM_2_66_6]|nr:MAG: 3-methyl-2-oxobutanoate hydroxymethyltransferase [Actinobacteria bacterium 13_2_20CM_2_66_6]TME94004.1 MAG: 3-methyl-2-oxobutanoate hydroxymethyltransferase [Chloroflexota bacterium]